MWSDTAFTNLRAASVQARLVTEAAGSESGRPAEGVRDDAIQGLAQVSRSPAGSRTLLPQRDIIWARTAWPAEAGPLPDEIPGLLEDDLKDFATLGLGKTHAAENEPEIRPDAIRGEVGAIYASFRDALQQTLHHRGQGSMSDARDTAQKALDSAGQLADLLLRHDRLVKDPDTGRLVENVMLAIGRASRQEGLWALVSGPADFTNDLRFGDDAPTDPDRPLRDEEAIQAMVTDLVEVSAIRFASAVEIRTFEIEPSGARPPRQPIGNDFATRTRQPEPDAPPGHDRSPAMTASEYGKRRAAQDALDEAVRQTEEAASDLPDPEDRPDRPRERSGVAFDGLAPPWWAAGTEAAAAPSSESPPADRLHGRPAPV